MFIAIAVVIILLFLFVQPFRELLLNCLTAIIAVLNIPTFIAFKATKKWNLSKIQKDLFLFFYWFFLFAVLATIFANIF